MGRKNKLKKFAELAELSNVFENTSFVRFDQSLEEQDRHPNRGLWRENIFKNNNPITLELACGKGEYTLALAQKYPEQNFIGVDIKGNRIWKGAKNAQALQLQNAIFLRTRIELLPVFFAADEIDQIWITFPDPFLKKSRINNRLTATRFLDLYLQVVKMNSTLHLKTDDPTLYEFSLESIQAHQGYKIQEHHFDIYTLSQLPHPDLEIKTYYEGQHLEDSRLIKYIRFERI